MQWKWRKLGRIFEPGQYEWLTTHAQNPFPQRLDGDNYRIHFAGRDPQNRARGAYLEIDITKPLAPGKLCTEPTLDLGPLGAFDDSGIMPSCHVEKDGLLYMYYTGWSKAVTTPFTFFIGLMVSEDGGKSYTRYSQAPVLGRDINSPFLAASPTVWCENGLFRMWYVSGTGWDPMREGEAKQKHYYRIGYAESADGIAWNTFAEPAIDYGKDEYAIARPTLFKQDDLYCMWYSFRGGDNTYRIGYAESKDGNTWERHDDRVGIDVSESGWDSEMLCYGWVFDHDGTKYMIYNGNCYGETGMGLAVAE